MTRPRPLPEALARQPFTVAEARRLRVGERRLRARDLERPFHGVRRPADGSPEPSGRREQLARSCRDFAPLLKPGDRFSHLSALALYGLPLPLTHEHDHSLHITRPATRGVVRRSGVVTHRVHHEFEVRHRSGLPVSSPVDLFREIAALFPLDDVVAVGDALVLERRLPGGNRQRPLVRLEELQQALVLATERGIRPARAALQLVRPNVESPMESRLRLLVTRAGLPEPVPGAEIRNASGQLLGYADLLWPDLRLVLEYDGDQHRSDRRQYERDIRRLESFGEAGFDVLRVRRDGLLLEPSATAARVTRAFEKARLRAESTRTAAPPGR